MFMAEIIHLGFGLGRSAMFLCERSGFCNRLQHKYTKLRKNEVYLPNTIETALGNEQAFACLAGAG